MPTPFQLYIQTRDLFIEDVANGRESQRCANFSLMEQYLRESFEQFDVQQTETAAQKLINSYKAKLNRHFPNLDQGPRHLSDFNGLSIILCGSLSELAINAIQIGFDRHKDLLGNDQSNKVIAIANQLVTAIFDFTRVNIFCGKIVTFSLPREWDKVENSYQVPLRLISRFLKQLQNFHYKDSVAFKALENAFINHSLTIIQLCLTHQRIGALRGFLTQLNEVLQYSQGEYSQAREQCAAWLRAYMPELLVPTNIDVVEEDTEVGDDKKPSEKRLKKCRQRLNALGKKIDALSLEESSITALLQIEQQLQQKDSAEASIVARIAALQGEVKKKLEAIQASLNRVVSAAPPVVDPVVDVSVPIGAEVVVESAPSSSMAETVLVLSSETIVDVVATPSSSSSSEVDSQALKMTVVEVHADTAKAMSDSEDSDDDCESDKREGNSSDITVISKQQLHKQNLKQCRQKKLDAVQAISEKLSHLADLSDDNDKQLQDLQKQLRHCKQGEANKTVLKAIELLEKSIEDKKTQYALARQPVLLPEVSEASPLVSQESSDNVSSINAAPLKEVPLVPKCQTNPYFTPALQAITELLRELEFDAFLFGSANYKWRPTDLDLLINPQDGEQLVKALLAAGATFKGRYEKPQRQVVKLQYLGVDIDINLTELSLKQHARCLDFSVGALYFNLRTNVMVCGHQHADIHLKTKKLCCIQHKGNSNMVHQDFSVILRAIRLKGQEKFSWSSKLKKAIAQVAAETNPFGAENGDKLYYEMTRLFAHGCAKANFELLLKTGILCKFFMRLEQLAPELQDKAIYIMRQAAQLCDTSPQPPSLMYFAVHWLIFPRNQPFVIQAEPSIRLQVGDYPLWNEATYQQICSYLMQCEMTYDHWNLMSFGQPMQPVGVVPSYDQVLSSTGTVNGVAQGVLLPIRHQSTPLR